MKAYVCLCGIFAASSVLAAPFNGNMSGSGTMMPSNGSMNSSTMNSGSMDRGTMNSGSMNSGSMMQNAPQSSDSRVLKNNDSWNPTYDSTASATKASDRFTTGDDQKLGSQIRQQIVELIGIPRSGDVVLYVDYGDVKLIGKVPSDEVKNRISQIIREIKGVKSLNNRLETANATTSGTSTTGFKPNTQAPLSANTNPSANPYYNTPQSNVSPYNSSAANINQPGSYYNSSSTQMSPQGSYYNRSTQSDMDQYDQNQPTTTYYRTSGPTNMNPSNTNASPSNQPSTTYYRSTNPNPQSVNSYYNRSSSSNSQSYTTPSNDNPSNNMYNNPSYTGATPSYTTPRQSYTGSSVTPTYNRY